MQLVSFFFDLGPQNLLFPSGAIWVDIREKYWMGRLAVLPNDEEMLLTDMIFKVWNKI